MWNGSAFGNGLHSRLGVGRIIDERCLDELRANNRRRDALQTERIVCFLPNWVINPANHLLNAEGMLRNLGRQDIAVVAVCYRRECVGVFDARSHEHIFICAVADNGRATKVRSQTLKSLAVEVNDGDLVTIFDHDIGQGRPHAPAAKNQQSHIPFFSGRCPECVLHAPCH